MTVHFGDEGFMIIRREGGHLLIQARAFYAGGNVEGADIDLISI